MCRCEMLGAVMFGVDRVVMSFKRHLVAAITSKQIHYDHGRTEEYGIYGKADKSRIRVFDRPV